MLQRLTISRLLPSGLLSLKDQESVPYSRSSNIERSTAMAMAVDTQQRHLGSMGYDNMPYSSAPQFTNPWATTTPTNATSHLFPLTQNNLGLDALAKQQAARVNNVSMPYTSIPVSAPSLGAGSNFSTTSYGQPSLLNLSQNLLNPQQSSYGNDNTYTSAPSPNQSAYAPTFPKPAAAETEESS